MQREIEIKARKINYTLRRSKRARRVSLTVGCDAKVAVTIPWRAPEDLARSFIQKKINWLVDKIRYFQNEGRPLIPGPNKKDYLKYQELARQIIEKKIAYFNAFYNFEFKQISIRNQKSRWGSCSKDGNLNFNYRIVFLSEKLSDYIIIHELCHLREFNHSPKFWKLVSAIIPDYKNIRKKIRTM